MTGLTLRGRRRARLLAEVLFKDYIPGGENCRLRRVAEYPGVCAKPEESLLTRNYGSKTAGRQTV